MYYLNDNNILIIRMPNHNTFIQYSKIIKFLKVDFKVDIYKLKIKLDMNDFSFVSTIDNKLFFNKVFTNFNKALKSCNSHINKFNIEDILIIQNNNTKVFVVLGFDLGYLYNNPDKVFRKINSSYNGTICNDLKYVCFFDKIDKEEFSKIKNYFYQFDITIFTNQEYNTKYYPVFKYENNSENYLSSIFRFLEDNNEVIDKFDMICIYKKKFIDNIFNDFFMNTFENYVIIGKHDKENILSNVKYSALFKKLCKDNLQNNLVLYYVYNDFDQIIISTQYLLKIMKYLEDINIEKFSIICNFFNSI